MLAELATIRGYGDSVVAQEWVDLIVRARPHAN